MCPPHASTAVSLSAVNVIEICDSADPPALRSPSLAYEMPVMVPPNMENSRSLAGRELKSVVGCPATGDPEEPGAGMGNVVSVAESPETPDVGSTVSAACPNPRCGLYRSYDVT